MFRARVPRCTSGLLLCAIAACAGGCDRVSDQKTSEAGEVRVVATIGRTGRGPGEFLYPRAIAVSGDGSLAVVDKTGRIQRFWPTSPAGAFDKNLGQMRMPLVEAGKPTGLTFWPKLSKKPGGYLYVADTHYHRVVVFSLGGEVVGQFGKFGEEGGCFIYPTDIAFASDGRMFVSEYGGNDRVSVFAIPRDGTVGEAFGQKSPKFLGSFGSPGSGRGQFRRPAALCVDEARGRLYVADACNHRIAVYDLRSQPTSPPERGDPPAIPVLIGYIGSPGRERGELRYPYDLALRDDGVLVVCEYGNNRIQLFGTDGRSLGTHGRPGRGLGELAYPWGVAVGGGGKIYVVDAGNNRLQVWEL